MAVRDWVGRAERQSLQLGGHGNWEMRRVEWGLDKAYGGWHGLIEIPLSYVLGLDSMQALPPVAL